MGTPVDANGRSVLHKGHGMTHASAVPDVCKTPSPGGPVPLPYPNMAMDSNLTDGADSVKIEGNPVANVKAKIATSTGDEPGSVGGIMSNVIKGTCTWKMGSLNVKAEGQSVVRFADATFHNGNAFNVAFIAQGGMGLGYANDFDGPCPLCNQSPDVHAIPSLSNSAALCAEIIQRLREQPVKRVSPKKKGYMVGAMVTACDKKYAAKSGGPSDGFDAVVREAGATPVAPAAEASFVQMVNANTSQTAENIFGSILGAWLNAEFNFEDGVQGYNYPGSCAGAKLLANTGHRPASMTEMWFQPKNRPGPSTIGPYRARSNGLRIDDRAYSSAGEIGSCNTCQDILFMTMCPERNC